MSASLAGCAACRKATVLVKDMTRATGGLPTHEPALTETHSVRMDRVFTWQVRKFEQSGV